MDGACRRYCRSDMYIETQATFQVIEIRGKDKQVILIKDHKKGMWGYKLLSIGAG